LRATRLTAASAQAVAATLQALTTPSRLLILSQLRQAGLIKSRRGAHGGYWLSRPAAEISVADVIRAVEGPMALVRGERPENVEYHGSAEPLMEVWVAVRAALRGVLSNVSLADIATVTRTIAARKDDIDAGIVNAAKTADHSARVTAQLGPIVERMGRAANAVEKMGNEVALAGTATSKTVNAVGGEAQRFAADTLPEIQRLVGELSDLSNSLRRLSEQTARDPAGLIRGRSPVPNGPGETDPQPTSTP